MEIKSKKEIRSQVKSERKAALPEEIIKNSQAIGDRFLSLTEYQKAKVVFAYVDCKNEVQTKAVIQHCWTDGKIVAVPKVLGEQMKYYIISSFEDLEKGYFGIEEPKHELLEEIVCEDGLMILPGIAFDTHKHRVGYGGGFYDKYLELHPNMVKIAFAFEFQMFDQVPFEPFDIKPDKIITENRIII